MERENGKLFIGESLDAAGERNGERIDLKASDLTTHGVIVGMTGSGKTGLGVVLLEEALASNIPVLAIDPKGDLGNLCLTFPSLDAPSFEPWMDEASAKTKGQTTAEAAEKTAQMWKDSLASWDISGDDVAALQSAANPIIFTPGSDTGVPLDILGRLTAPTVTDKSALQEEIDSTVTGLLTIVGVESDPLSGREHILLANILAKAWGQGTDLDMATLLAQILEPPMRKLGVLDLDTFFPPKDRQALVMKLNGLLASPSFQAWAHGHPLDIDKMLWDSQGNARAAVVSLSHLNDEERQFAVTLLLSKMISWMRSQSGTSELKALVYIDEVMGYAPPTSQPPTKKPILTLLKQARAFGVGLVLSTQNPVDLDYKALSNAGTWLIGRLQTEQDKARLVDGLRAADGSTDIEQLNNTISDLGKRQFVLRSIKSSGTSLFTTRWAMSYLAGPLNRTQISSLMKDKKAALVSAPATEASPTTTGAAPAVTQVDDSSSAVAPTLPDSAQQKFLHPAAPWGATIGADASQKTLQLMAAARVSLLFDETKAELRHSQEWETIIPLTADGFDLDNAIEIDFDDRDFTDAPPEGARFALPDVDISASLLKKTVTALKNKLYTEQTLTLSVNKELKLWSRPEESAEDFAARCEAAADEHADAATEKIRKKLEAKQATVSAALAKAEDKVAELEAQESGNKRHQIFDVGASILGGLLGGRKNTRGLASAARKMSSGSKRNSSTKARLESAENRAAEKIEQLEDLEAELQEAVIEIDELWTEKANAIEQVEISLEKTDITVEDMICLWVPAHNS